MEFSCIRFQSKCYARHELDGSPVIFLCLRVLMVICVDFQSVVPKTVYIEDKIKIEIQSRVYRLYLIIIMTAQHPCTCQETFLKLFIFTKAQSRITMTLKSNPGLLYPKKYTIFLSQASHAVVSNISSPQSSTS